MLVRTERRHLGQLHMRPELFSRRIDIRGEGGYATAPPSVHASGKPYVWQSYDRFAALPRFDPEWIIDKSKSARVSCGEQIGNVRHAVSYIRRMSDWNETNATPLWSATDLAHNIRSTFASLANIENSTSDITVDSSADTCHEALV